MENLTIVSALAAFYHANIIGPEFGIDEAFSWHLFAEQMQAFVACHLYAAVDYFFAGFNDDVETVKKVQLPWNAKVVAFGDKARSELPTMRRMQEWCKEHSNYYVLYWHAKGVTHPGDSLNRSWRLCMERVVLWDWRKCVAALERGYDSAGAHWLTREKYGEQVKTPFWGGNMFWITAKFVNTLPELPKTSHNREEDFIAESWIGTGPRLPRVMDFRQHWPGLVPCTKGAQ